MNVPTTPGLWNWESGICHNQVRYTVSDAAKPGVVMGEVTWSEEVDPMDDERGYGSHVESKQTLADFLNSGPRYSPPVSVVEAMLAHLQVGKPVWFDPYCLLDAVGRQDQETVKALLEQNVSADMPIGGLTPLFWAVQLRNYTLAEMLFVAGVDVNRRFSGRGETILMHLAGSAPDASWAPLAARIIAGGVNLEAQNEWGETALMAAASAGTRLPGLVGLLLQAGAEVNTRSKHGYTALMKSVMSRYVPSTVVQTLLEAGAEVNVQDEEGWSPLMWAISCSLVECVRCLLEAGADVHSISTPTQKYREPKSVLQLAEDYANPEIITLIREILHREDVEATSRPVASNG